MEEATTNVIKPQEGYQMMALSSSADILIGGGAAGVGKTFSLLLEPLRNIHVKDFGAVFFRRTSPQIKAQGGLWDASQKLYNLLDGANPKSSVLEWHFENSKIKFSHLEYEKNIYDWQGSEIPLLCFDELTHFTKKMFFYMLSRNRTTCGVKPYVRATCNPDPDSWVADFIEWFIDDDGFPIPERQGKLRYFVKDGESFIWGNTLKECVEKADYYIKPLMEASRLPAKNFVKSMTFIGGSIYDNKELLKINPEYLANLASQDEESRKQLLDGNWKVSMNPADIYDYNVFRDYFTNTWVEAGEKCITVDVAMDGSDCLMINYFEGKRWEDVDIINKSSGKDVVDRIKNMQSTYKVPNSRVVYDADGVGAFIGGEGNAYIEGAYAFKNNSKQIPTEDGRQFKNLKAQCYVLDGEDKNQFISKKVSIKMFDNKMTMRQRLMYERKAIKKKEKRDEEPETLIPKQEMKQKYLNGQSPDCLDAFMMKRVFYLSPRKLIYNYQKTQEIPKEAKHIVYGLGLKAQPSYYSIVSAYLLDNTIYLDEILHTNELQAKDLPEELNKIGLNNSLYMIGTKDMTVEINALRNANINALAVKDLIIKQINQTKQYNLKVTSTSLNLIQALESWYWKTGSNGIAVNEPDTDEPQVLKAIRMIGMSRSRWIV